MPKKINSKFPGVRYYEHPTRKHGIKKDRNYSIRYSKGKKQLEEQVGWASEGWTETKVAGLLAEIRENIRRGEGPQTLKEKKALQNEAREAQEAARIQAEKDSLTFEDFFINTYLGIARQEKKKETWKTELGHFKVWIRPAIGKKALRDVKKLDIEQLKRKMLEKGKSVRTVQNCLATVRRVFNEAEVHGLYEGFHPCRGVKIKRPNNKRHRWFTVQEAEELMDALKIKHPTAHDMALLALDCGLRRGEILSLTWDCVDFHSGHILIKDPKGGTDRHAHMSEGVKKMLKGRVETNKKFVFCGKEGNAYTGIPKAYSRIVNSLGFNDGVEDTRNKAVFHTLRHTYATWLMRDGIDLFTLKNLLGHENIEMTMRYSHHARDKGEAAAARIDAIKRNGIKEVDSPDQSSDREF